MAAHTPSPHVAAASSPAPYRLRKCVMSLPAPTLSDAASLIERAGQQDLVLRWVTTARVLEELGQFCESLAELARVSELADPSEASGDAPQQALGQLRALIGLTAAVSARIGAEAQDRELRTLCFELARTCQHTQARIRSQQLWWEAR